MKKLIIILLFVVIVPGVSFAINTHTKEVIRSNTYRALHFCQCANCDLQGADLSGFKPGDINFAKNSILKLDPDSTYKKNETVTVDDCGWMSCNFSGANLQHANLNNSNFIASLRGDCTPLSSAHFAEANLQFATMRDALLSYVDFYDADLTGADLTNANLKMANLSSANLSQANLQHVDANCDAMHGWGANFSKANFTGADLQNAMLCGDFRGANFAHANLMHARLSSSSDATQTDTDGPELWEGVDFTGANLQGASIWNDYLNKPGDISKAILCNTTMPDGSISDRDCKDKKDKGKK